MATLVFIGAMGFSALLDVTAAITITHVTASLFWITLSWYHYFLVAPLIGIFPDLDALFQLASQKKIDDAHHTILHKPLLMATVGFFVGTFLFGLPWGLIVMFSWLAHYIHDCCEDGLGLMWLLPLNDNRYRIIRGRIGGKKYAFTPQEYEQLYDPHYGNLRAWLRRDYYQPTFYSVIELAISAFVLFVVILAYHAAIAALVWMLVLLGGMAFWTLAKKYAL